MNSIVFSSFIFSAAILKKFRIMNKIENSIIWTLDKFFLLLCKILVSFKILELQVLQDIFLSQTGQRPQLKWGPFEDPHSLKITFNYECHANCCGLRDEL